MKKSSVVLIVEDNPEVVRLIKGAFKMSSSTLYFARDGSDATHFLETRRQEGLPQLIVLDLNLPQKSGFEVLQFVKRDAMLKRIPVIVLSASQNPEDVARAYDLHANCYLTKPATFDAFIAVVKTLEYFWVQMAPPPPPARSAADYRLDTSRSSRF